MDEVKKFEAERRDNIRKLGQSKDARKLALDFVAKSSEYKYSYNFSWMGRPIIQYPQDMIAMQEIIWEVKPDLIIETGIAHGGSLVYYASLLELIGHGEVIGIDIDIRDHNRTEIERHPMFKRISMIEGSSIDEIIIDQVKAKAQGMKSVLVALDSNHTHDHVLRELELYSRFVTKGSYLVVFDTIVEDMSPDFYPDRPWGHGDNPKTAVHAFIAGNHDFVIDHEIDHKILISVSPEGYLKRIK